MLSAFQIGTVSQNMVLLSKQAQNLVYELQPIIPAILLSALFFSSTQVTEAISKSKYTKAFDAYQKRVGKFSPVATLFQGVLVSLGGEAKRREIESLVWGNVGADVKVKKH
jgi:hypothetical protein